MAPELFKYHASKNRPEKGPVDIFALGTLIYEVLYRTVYAKSKCIIHQQVLTGQEPFHGYDQRVVRFLASKGEKLAQPSWTPIPNHPTWDMVERCRAKEPEDRPKLTEVLKCLTLASEDPPAEWLLPPQASPLPSFLGLSSWTEPSPRTTPMPPPPVPPLSHPKMHAQPLMRHKTAQLLAYKSGSEFRWGVVEGGTKKREPRPKKRETS